MAKLLINPPNFLLLDEPTTHLDVDAVEALVRALTDYQGTLVFISHDIYFVRSVANMVYEVKSGRIRKFPGAFDYYFEKKDSSEPHNEQHKVKSDHHKQNIDEGRLRLKEEEKARKSEDKKRKAHNAALRAAIIKLESGKEKLKIESYAKARSLSNPKFYQDEDKAKEYGRRLKEIEKELLDMDSRIKELESQIL